MLQWIQIRSDKLRDYVLEVGVKELGVFLKWLDLKSRQHVFLGQRQFPWATFERSRVRSLSLATLWTLRLSSFAVFFHKILVSNAWMSVTSSLDALTSLTSSSSAGSIIREYVNLLGLWRILTWHLDDDWKHSMSIWFRALSDLSVPYPPKIRENIIFIL